MFVKIAGLLKVSIGIITRPGIQNTSDSDRVLTRYRQSVFVAIIITMVAPLWGANKQKVVSIGVRHWRWYILHASLSMGRVSAPTCFIVPT